MKYLVSIMLLTFSLFTFAGIWPSPSSGGNDGNEATATSTNLITNINTPTALSGSLSNSDADAKAKAKARAKAKIGDITNVAKGSKQEQSADNDNNISYYTEATEATASSAPSISVGLGQNGASGQSKKYGASFLSNSSYSDILNQAAVERANAERSLNDKDKKAHYANAHMLDQMALDYVIDTSTTGKWATIAMHVGQILLVVILGGAI